MKIKVKFQEVGHKFTTKFVEEDRAFKINLKDVVIVNRVDIPPEYGLITYDNNRVITVS